MDNVKITISGSINNWIFNSLKEDYFDDFKLASEKFTIEPFYSFSDFLFQVFQLTLDNDSINDFVSRFDSEQLNDNCPLFVELLHNIRENGFTSLDVVEAISLYQVEDIFMITEDCVIEIWKNTEIIFQKEVGDLFNEINYFNMGDFDENDSQYIAAKNEIINVYNKNSSSGCFPDELNYILEGASIGFGSIKLMSGIKYCPVNILDHYLNYEKDNGYSLKNSYDNVVISYEFICNKFNLNDLTFLKLDFSRYHDDYWSNNNMYAFTEILHKGNFIEKKYEIINEGGLNIYFDGDEASYEANFKYLVGND
jgi:hypothetical protein